MESNEIKTENCKGCYGCYLEDRRRICFLLGQVDEECPCNMCLVKVICNEACIAYYKFWDKTSTPESEKKFIASTIENVK